ncbi:MAG TPA: universal stress protein [Telluria sp.]|nr:universal stress protein [Telluria sp.]
MFKHILLPTDGSAAAHPAIDACLRFAREIGARVTALHVAPSLHIFAYEPGVTESVRQTVLQDREEHSKKYLDDVERRAAAAGVPCERLLVTSDFPHEAIIEAARDHQCDLIAMASHGRGGIRGLLLGSETQKVLTHSAIPVMVWRGGGPETGAPVQFLS